MERIWLSSPHMGENERKYVAEAFETNWIAPLGPNVDSFELQIAKFLDVKSVLALNSGTAALHLALQILGVRKGDIVICQSLTFAATAFPISYCSGVPVFIDSEIDTWNMDPVLLEEAIKRQMAKGKKPAAIIIVHLYGMPAKMDEVLEIAQRYEIPVIEDAAEALGSTYKGKACGSLGNIAILSFNGNKIITTSGGGAFTSNNENFVNKARHFSAQAKEPAPYYLHKEIGYNYRLSNVLAGIGRGQMEVLPQRVKRRREVFDCYKKELSGIPGINFLPEPQDVFSNRWLTTIIINSDIMGSNITERIRLYLEKQNIESRNLWKPLHQQPVFAGYEVYNNGVADSLFANGLCLPSGSNLSDENLNRVIYEIKNCINEN